MTCQCLWFFFFWWFTDGNSKLLFSKKERKEKREDGNLHRQTTALNTFEGLRFYTCKNAEWFGKLRGRRGFVIVVCWDSVKAIKGTETFLTIPLVLIKNRRHKGSETVLETQWTDNFESRGRNYEHQFHSRWEMTLFCSSVTCWRSWKDFVPGADTCLGMRRMCTHVVQLYPNWEVSMKEQFEFQLHYLAVSIGIFRFQLKLSNSNLR